jgi:predicted RNA binding protein YcfA (HicA-like mRNA interferase family)
MAKYSGFSFKDVIQGLRRAGFEVVSQKGSHIKLRKSVTEGKLTVIVPKHKELSPGVLRSIREMSGLDEDEFFGLIK